MKLSRRHLSTILAERTMHVRDSRELATSIAAYLLDTKHTHQLDSILRDILQYRAEKGILEARVVSAYPLSSDVHADVRAELHEHFPHAKTIVINEELDADLVGGLRTELIT